MINIFTTGLSQTHRMHFYCILVRKSLTHMANSYCCKDGQIIFGLSCHLYTRNISEIDK